jgi:hypothetical protein
MSARRGTIVKAHHNAPSLRRRPIVSAPRFSTSGVSASIAAAACALALGGCAGRGSLPAGTTGSQSLDAASVHGKPPVTNPYPFTQGDVFNYDYATTTSTKTTGGGTVKTTRKGTSTQTVEGQVKYAGQTLTDLHEADAYTDDDSSKKQIDSGTLTSDHYRTFLTGSGGSLQYVSWGDQSTDDLTESDGTTVDTTTGYTYDAAYVIDYIPETKQTWDPEIPHVENGSTVTTSGSVVVTTSYDFTRNSDLSYVRDYTYQKTGEGEFKETDTENADGSGSDVNNGKTDPTAGTTTWSAPAQTKGKYFITVDYTPPGGSEQTTNVPDWYPGKKAVESLTTDTRTDAGTVKVPKTCGKAVAGQSAVEIDEAHTILDIIAGTWFTEADAYYVVSGEGFVCATTKYTEDTYDNRKTGKLLSTVTYDFTSSLTSESLEQLRSKHEVVGFRGPAFRASVPAAYH